MEHEMGTRVAEGILEIIKGLRDPSLQIIINAYIGL